MPVLHLTEEESAELQLLLDDVDLSPYPQLQRIQKRLQIAKHTTSTIPTADPPPVPHPASSCLSTPPDRDHDPRPADHHPSPLAVSQPEYKWTDNDDDFRRALNKLRRDRTQTLYGLAILNNLGPYIIMGDSVLDDIAVCARAHKLASLDDLYRETGWYQTWELGGQVLELVSRYYPQPIEGASGPPLGSDEGIRTP